MEENAKEPIIVGDKITLPSTTFTEYYGSTGYNIWPNVGSGYEAMRNYRPPEPEPKAVEKPNRSPNIEGERVINLD